MERIGRKQSNYSDSKGGERWSDCQRDFVITVQRDTDGDGEPDITDTDDDGDGFTDIEEEEKGTDPKDPNSVPQVDPKPVKPDQKQDPEISQNKVVNKCG